MTPAQLSDAIVAALDAQVETGTLRLPDGVPNEVVIERPRNKEHGDYATNIALRLAKKAGMAPRELAQSLADALGDTEGIAKVEIAGPGFLNITVAVGAQGRVAAETLTGVYGKPAKRFVRAMKRVQSRLGDHHDAFVTQERLRELGDEAAGTGDNAFVFGVLHAREENALLETESQFVREWSKASKKKRRRWLAK